MYTEILRIIEGGLAKDPSKVYNYAKLLADNDIRVISSDDHESIEKLINQIKNRNFK